MCGFGRLCSHILVRSLPGNRSLGRIWLGIGSLRQQRPRATGCDGACSTSLIPCRSRRLEHNQCRSPFNFPAARLVLPLTECPCQMAALVRTIRSAILSLSTKWRHAMAKVKQLTVALENRPGTLAHMAKVLADAKGNIVALLNSTAGGPGPGQGGVDRGDRGQ